MYSFSHGFMEEVDARIWKRSPREFSTKSFNRSLADSSLSDSHSLLA